MSTMARSGAAVAVAVAVAVLAATAPDHGGTHAGGLLLGLVLAPLCALTFLIGWTWRRRSAQPVQPA
jgi:hypothetical protein